MEKFLMEQITPLIKRHGISFVMLCFVVYWQNNKMTLLEAQIDSLRDKYEQCLVQNSTISVQESISVIEFNTGKLKEDVDLIKSNLKIND